MALSQRPWSVNSYLLPLVWFHCHSIDMREGDFSKLSSLVKSWVFADCLEKPGELITYRQRGEGGLGIHHIKSKSKAILIKSFIESALNSKYKRNEYHNALFKWHVLKETNLQNPGLPPYYSASFFSDIREVYDSGKNIIKMTSKEWYGVLLDKNILSETNEAGERETKVMKVELKYPDVDWKRTWKLFNSRGLSGGQRSILFKILHNILPTRMRLFRMNISDSPYCELCPHNIQEDLPHALLECDHNGGVNEWIIAVLIDIDPGILNSEMSSTDIITLNLNLDYDAYFPAVLFLSIAFETIWKNRQLRKTVTLREVRSSILAEMDILKKTRHKYDADVIECATNFNF